MSDLLGDRRELPPSDPKPCRGCGSRRNSKSVVADHYFCLDCGELIEPSERTDDPRQMDMLG